MSRRMKFFSQVGQDRFLLENYFRGKRDGVFVDVGAYDGEKFSNSLFFERFMGWTGLCIEPQPAAFRKLAASRKARCLQFCVSDFEGEADFVECDAGQDETMLSGLTASFDARHAERLNRFATDRRSLKVPVRKLSNVLAEHGLFHVDYCSIDVEGAEAAILGELDLERFDISVFTVENNYGDSRLRDLMAAKGYQFAGRLEHDDVYCRPGLRRLPRTSVICAVWHGDPDRDALLKGHVENLARQSVPVTPIYVFDGGARPPHWFDGQAICLSAGVPIYQAWNAALSQVETPLAMNLNLDDRLAPDAVEKLEAALWQNQAAAVGGDWSICYSQAETDNVQPCYPAEQLPYVPSWPPPLGTRTRLGSGKGDRGTLGPAVMWRMDLHMGAPRYPWRFNDGSPMRVAGDAAWWWIIGNHMKKKLTRLPMVIGNYHSHPGEQAEFRFSAGKEHELLGLVGPSLL